MSSDQIFIQNAVHKNLPNSIITFKIENNQAEYQNWYNQPEDNKTTLLPCQKNSTEKLMYCYQHTENKNVFNQTDGKEKNPTTSVKTLNKGQMNRLAEQQRRLHQTLENKCRLKSTEENQTKMNNYWKEQAETLNLSNRLTENEIQSTITERNSSKIQAKNLNTAKQIGENIIGSERKPSEFHKNYNQPSENQTNAKDVDDFLKQQAIKLFIQNKKLTFTDLFVEIKNEQNIKQYSCIQCYQALNKIPDCENHYLDHIPSSIVFECTLCNETLYDETKEIVIEHLINHLKKTKQCNFCMKKFSIPYYARTCERGHFGQYAYSCDHCPRKFHYQSALKQHQSVHKPNETIDQFKCMQTAEDNKPQSDSACKSLKSTNEVPIVDFNAKINRQLQDNSIKKSKPTKCYRKPTPCPICKKIYSAFQGARLCEKAHLGQYRYSCDQCPRKFFFRRELQRHAPVHTPKPIAENSFDALKQDEDYSVITTNNIQKYQCLKCLKVFKGKQSLKLHILYVHVEGKDYNCSKCSKTFNNPISLKAHVKEHDKIYTCKSCGKSTKSRKAIKNCEKKHAGILNFQCVECPEKFVTNSYLIRHVWMKHKSETNETCKFCGFICKNEYHLREHVKRKHSGKEEKYECKTCNKVYSQKNTLRQHEQSHTGFQCNQCGKLFKSKKWLQDHELIHANIRPWECTKCDKKFTTKKTLSVHLDTHDNIRRHVCTHCNKAFTQRSSLKIHERIHTGEKPYKCDMCHDAFISKTLLDSHYSNLHAITKIEKKK